VKVQKDKDILARNEIFMKNLQTTQLGATSWESWWRTSSSSSSSRNYNNFLAKHGFSWRESDYTKFDTFRVQTCSFQCQSFLLLCLLNFLATNEIFTKN
jgi:hypothetical protein